MKKGCHWTVLKWGCEQVRQGHNFVIDVDGPFIEAASWAGVGQEEAQDAARHFAAEAGYKLCRGDALLTFGDYGIDEFRSPLGDGVRLKLEKSSISHEGARYSTENVEHASQQAFLMSLWVWWASYIQTRI